MLEQVAEKDAALQAKVKTVGNYVHDSVPISDNEDNNEVKHTWKPEGVTVEKRDCLSHHEVLHRIGGFDQDRGVKIGGHRTYFLTSWGVWLNQALIQYSLRFLAEQGYTPLQTPQMMNKEVMARTAQLSQFDEELYKVVVDDDPKNDKYLIATSEQPISALHAEEWLIGKDLPIKYAGHSTCYRKEAGNHGKEAWGIYRVHQFEKVSIAFDIYFWRACDVDDCIG